MASFVSVANKNKADIRDGNEYKIRKWLVLKFHGSVLFVMPKMYFIYKVARKKSRRAI
jgi:hypothetical protein